MNLKLFGATLATLRKKRAMTQSALAKELNVSDKAVSKWENGQAFPRIETFEKLVYAL